MNEINYKQYVPILKAKEGELKALQESFKCAAQTTGTGNSTTWRKVANNHHFQKVIVQLASLPAISAVP